jgi:thiamine transporter ThiT
VDYYLVFGSIFAAWSLTRIIYIIINYRLNKKLEACLGFVAFIVISLFLGMRPEYFIGGILWFILDLTGITNKRVSKEKKLKAS